jgi:hypothetical protein
MTKPFLFLRQAFEMHVKVLKTGGEVYNIPQAGNYTVYIQEVHFFYQTVIFKTHINKCAEHTMLFYKRSQFLAHIFQSK